MQKFFSILFLTCFMFSCKQKESRLHILDYDYEEESISEGRSISTVTLKEELAKEFLGSDGKAYAEIVKTKNSATIEIYAEVLRAEFSKKGVVSYDSALETTISLLTADLISLLREDSYSFKETMLYKEWDVVGGKRARTCILIFEK